MRLIRPPDLAPARRIAAVMAVLVAGAWPVAAQEPVGTPPEGSESPTPAETPISGRGAFLRSVVLPGWGQAYVGAPGRGAVYFAMEAGSSWMAYKSYHQLREARETEAWLRQAGRLADDETLDLVTSRAQQLEDWLAISIFLLLFSGADAYVTAQLADFDEHVGIRSAGGGGARLEVRVPFGRRRE